jgi:hypothetical protein
MLMYHCNMPISAYLNEIMSFNLVEMAMLIAMGWLPVDVPCLPGAII